MSTPNSIRSTAGFRYLAIYELTNGYPLGTLVREPFTPYTVSGSVISGSTVSVAAGATVSGSVGYYGVVMTGANVMTINDPAPRVIPHTGEDGVTTLHVLPALEPVTGELTIDKTNDVADSILSAVNRFTIGEMVMMGQATNKRGFENQVACLAYSSAQDTDPNSTSFGTQEWDYRIMPKAILFTRDTGYQAEANKRMYTLSPQYVTSHVWGTQFTILTEGFVRAQLVRGVTMYKPVIVGYLGDGVTVGFPFDSAKPAQATTKINVWVNGVIQTGAGISKSVSGVSFAVAPAASAAITVMYETAL